MESVWNGKTSRSVHTVSTPISHASETPLHACMTEEDEDTERVQASAWVSRELRSQWDDWAEELGYESRGAMIRNAVRYYYVSRQKDEQNQRILNKLDDLEDTTDRIESKTDSVKIDQLETSDIEQIAGEVEYAVTAELLRIFGEVDSLEEIERSTDG